MKNIFLIFLFLALNISAQAAIQNKLSYTPPKSWLAQNFNKQLSAIYTAGHHLGQKSASLVVMDFQKKISENEIEAFTMKSLRQAIPNSDQLKILTKGKFKNLKSANSYITFSFVKNGAPYKGNTLLYSMKDSYHLFYFTVGAEHYSTFNTDIQQVYSSIQTQ